MVFNFREQEQIQKLFNIAKGLVKPHKELNSVRVCVEAITLLSTHADIFREELKKSSSEIINM